MRTRYGFIICLLCVLLIGPGCGYRLPETRYENERVELLADEGPGRAERLLGLADEQIEAVSEVLGVSPPDVSLSIILFDNRGDMARYLAERCPQRVRNRAACCEISGKFVITVWGNPENDRVRLDLRHELTHYVMASHFRDIPPWIDEGLAVYCEVSPPGRPRGKRLSRIDEDDINVERLEELLMKTRKEPLTADEYALSWLLVHYLLDESPGGSDAVHRYLTEIRDMEGKEEKRKVIRECFGSAVEEMAPDLREYLSTM